MQNKVRTVVLRTHRSRLFFFPFSMSKTAPFDLFQQLPTRFFQISVDEIVFLYYNILTKRAYCAINIEENSSVAEFWLAEDTIFESEEIDMHRFENKIWLATPTMHGDEMQYVRQAYETNWMSTVGENINEVERIAAEKAQQST